MGLVIDKFEVANALRETGLLLDVVGGNPYKARAYLKGASAVESLAEDLYTIFKEERLRDIPGIGPALASNICEIYETGELSVLNRLKSDLPPGVIELSQVPGLTLKRIEALHDRLNISSLDQLEQACIEHRVASVKGFGAKTEATILEGLRAHRLNLKRMILTHARQSANNLQHYLKSATRNKSIEIVGQIRRWFEVVDEIKLVACTSDTQLLWKALQQYPLVTDTLFMDEKRCEVRLAEGTMIEVNASTNAAIGMIEHTGSDQHFRKLQAVAKSKGLTLNSTGLFQGARALEVKKESDVYRHLGLSFIPPELREGDIEITQASKEDFSDLIQVEDIRGMTHCHTTYSDGSYSIEQMALAAQKLGMDYITITDHSPLAHYAGGLTIDRLKEQWEEIDSVQENVDIKILKGTECDILADGKLDYPDSILDKFDLIIASVHNRFKLDYEHMTKRVLTCMKDSHFKIWGHPLGRLLLRREPIDCDVEKILDEIAESRAAIEINGDPYRMDLEPKWVRSARERGIKLIISTDAHSIRDYRSLEYGVHLARRAGVRRNEVLNTYDVAAFRSIVRPREVRKKV